MPIRSAGIKLAVAQLGYQSRHQTAAAYGGIGSTFGVGNLKLRKCAVVSNCLIYRLHDLYCCLMFCAASQGVVVVEGLDLSQVKVGWYHQICLPTKLTGADGAPVRCLLQSLDSSVLENTSSTGASTGKTQAKEHQEL
jgi:hypothetical protein